MSKLLHHGKCTGNFEVRNAGTDYFGFWCKKCNYQSEVTAILIDNAGRVIFNLRCHGCGETDALKTHPEWGSIKRGDPLLKFHLSPKLSSRIKRHNWDNA